MIVVDRVALILIKFIEIYDQQNEEKVRLEPKIILGTRLLQGTCVSSQSFDIQSQCRMKRNNTEEESKPIYSLMNVEFYRI